MAQGVDMLMSRFQSIGDNCEFGWVQRHFGAEALDLLRWVAISYEGLIDGLNHDFDGLFRRENLWPRQPGLVTDKRYDLTYHTQLRIGAVADGNMEFLCDDTQGLELQHGKEASRIKFMVGKFLEDLTEGHRIYVRKQEPPLTKQQMEGVFSALSRRRPQKLLCVSTAADGLVAGDVRLVAPGIKIAVIGRLAGWSTTNLADYDGWEVICRKAAMTPWS